MNVVSYAEAARRAGVTRQRINGLKKAKTDGRKDYPFFIFDPIHGDPGVDIDHPDWKEYELTNNPKRGNKKDKSRARVRPRNSPIGDLETMIQHLLTAVDEALVAVLGLQSDELNAVKQEIKRRYAAMAGEK